MKTILEAKAVTKVYQQGSLQVHALAGVDLQCAQGEFTALVGPSGSGKTTLLNLIGVLDRPSSGEVLVDGEPTAHLGRSAAAEFRLRKIGFVFQAYNLIPVLTAYENAEYTLLLQGVGKEERRRVVEPLLERVGLSRSMFTRRPHELSGGQQQRVAVVRAIASKPAVVLADEPTANLDTATSESLLQLMEELNREHGVTFVFASHDTMLMERVRRVVHLRDGKIERDEVRGGQQAAG